MWTDSGGGGGRETINAKHQYLVPSYEHHRQRRKPSTFDGFSVAGCEICAIRTDYGFGGYGVTDWLKNNRTRERGEEKGVKDVCYAIKLSGRCEIILRGYLQPRKHCMNGVNTVYLKG